MKTRLLLFLTIPLLIVANRLHAQSMPSNIFTNPTPEATDYFGNAVAAVGTDKVLIGAFRDNTGADQAGAAYLFSTSGTLLTTYSNPAPASSYYFGNAVSAVGADKVLIAAPGNGLDANGAVHLFSTNGMLLNTFTNPTPENLHFFGDAFGIAVAAVDTNKVLIGAQYEKTNDSFYYFGAGVAYLFNTDGTLLSTFTNPTTPTNVDFFGWAMAAVNTDKVLIGAQWDNTGAEGAGAAYLFSISGTFLNTFTNPTPEIGDNFGTAVAAVGADKVLIGARWDTTGAEGAGAAYLYSTSGTLLTTFTNPAPASTYYFGSAVAAVGTDKVLIAAPGDGNLNNFSAVYLFSTTGTLLNIFTNPAPTVLNNFGNAVAVVGTDKVLIAADGDSIGATNAGAAYLFNINPTFPNPQLRIVQTATATVVVAWPAHSAGWTLQFNTNLTTTIWAALTNAVGVVGTENQVIIEPSSGNKFFRLYQP